MISRPFMCVLALAELRTSAYLRVLYSSRWSPVVLGPARPSTKTFVAGDLKPPKNPTSAWDFWIV